MLCCPDDEGLDELEEEPELEGEPVKPVKPDELVGEEEPDELGGLGGCIDVGGFELDVDDLT